MSITPTQAKAEPWLRGTLSPLSPIPRALFHSLEMAEEDTARHCAHLTDAEINATPFHLPSVGFHLRHIARSLDRFCCYAEETPLQAAQFAALATELTEAGTRETIFMELTGSFASTRKRLESILQKPLDRPIAIGRKGLPTTLGGLLIHAAEHTQRHVGQAITTARVVAAPPPAASC